LGAILKMMVLVTPQKLVTPSLLFVGVMSSAALDSGYIVLPPLAAAVFLKANRSPLVGMGAVFAGVAAGFSANLLITGLDPLLQSLTQDGAQIIDPNYEVDIRCNYYFMIASTIMITFVGWAITSWIVEPRFSAADIAAQAAASADHGSDRDGTDANNEAAESTSVTPMEWRGMLFALGAFLVAAGIILAMVFIPQGALSGKEPTGRHDAWVQAIVPILFVLFLIPGLAYGIATGSVKSDRDAANMMGRTMSSMGPYIVMAFFAAQFVSWFGHSNLGTMVALEGVEVLRSVDMPRWVLVISIVLLSAALNLFIGSASAKWTLISAVFVPLFLPLGVSPELTQAAYRIGDSVTNAIAPLNPYMVIILVFMRRYEPKAGLGSLISLMLPYTLAFTVAWILLLGVWMAMGWDLGPGGSPLFVEPMVGPPAGN
ncbi:MAG: AbgT family transporter, partial [Pirellulaceae bacterium]|nr:AbgT family transporter [Pirellulaceae bacterium]